RTAGRGTRGRTPGAPAPRLDRVALRHAHAREAGEAVGPLRPSHERAVFASAARGDLRGPLLWAGLLLGLTEVGLASAWRREK
ncbi:MAG TPA: hypothetical protein VFK09_03445, partial [Gemmatimonadales bacterium]|nr:hypothetical protein [Gemmatimonadales bacterium]